VPILPKLLIVIVVNVHHRAQSTLWIHGLSAWPQYKDAVGLAHIFETS